MSGSGLTLYHFPPSGPSRGALLAARAVGVPVRLHHLDLFNKEQLRDSFLKVNPQHVVPTLDDDGYVLWESQAIACYLADKYAKDDQLYPRDLKRRSLVNQRLFFDASNLYQKVRAVCFPILFLGETKINEVAKINLNTTLGFLEQFLSDSDWLAGDNYTIADTANFASLSSILAVGWEMSSWPNIQRWVKACETLPGWEENQEGAKLFGEAVRKNIVE